MRVVGASCPFEYGHDAGASGACEQCDATCDSCSGGTASDCVTCGTAAPNKHIGTCVATCPAGFYADVTELPVAYNAFKKTWLQNASDWEEVFVLHDPDVHRSKRIPHQPLERRYANLTWQAHLLVDAMARELKVHNRG